MRNPHGSYIWYELLTSDVRAAGEFYGPIAGWKIEEHGSDYNMILAADGIVGGAMAISADMAAHGARPCWLGYIGVDDVDAAVTDVLAGGGSVLMPARDIDAGRFAMLADPQGAPFYVMRGKPDERSRAYELGTPGHFGWNELHTRDSEAALAFYVSRFGWTEGEAMDMGAMGKYRIFESEGAGVGAVFNNPNVPHPMWLYYICVADIDLALEQITTLGGEVILQPTEVPNNVWIIQARDPQGAMFALVGPRPNKD